MLRNWHLPSAIALRRNSRGVRILDSLDGEVVSVELIRWRDIPVNRGMNENPPGNMPLVFFSLLLKPYVVALN